MITILMATYNGEAFIAEQIDSLLSQTVQDFVLHIQDDCSNDGTLEILQAYSVRYPKKFLVKQNLTQSGGAKYNFIRMMIAHKDDYVMLCDQDDVWMPDKIEKTLGKMREMEAQYGKDTPLLVHTDLRVVDETLLNVISPSLKIAMNANNNRVQLKDHLIQNTLTGCTVLYNRALANLICAEPTYMMMHDWWLMLVACAFGRIGHIDAQTVLYRQHSNNEIGARNVRTLRYKINRLLHPNEMREIIRNTYLQAQSLLSIYRSMMTEEQIVLIETYCCIPKLSKWQRWRTMCRLGVLKDGIARKIACFINI